ncbi:hypothetical protein ACB092_02G136600 [Castanea dentata]
MAGKLDSFRYTFTEKRERLLSTKGYSELGGFNPLGPYEEEEEEDRVSRLWRTVKDVGYKAWKMGRTDPRKIVFSAKMGLALTLISLLIFLKEPVKDLSRYSVWAILTVVVVKSLVFGIKESKVK